MAKINLIFDLDNTLSDFNYTEQYAIKCIYEYLGLVYSIDEYNRYYQFHNEYWKEFENSKQEIKDSSLSKIDYVRSKIYVDYFKELNLSIETGLKLSQIYIDNLGVKNKLYPNAKDILDYLSSMGYQLYMASNGPRESQIRKMINMNIYKYFAQLITAEDCGYSKPNINFFKYMLKSFNIEAKDSIFIGDSLQSDIKGANDSDLFTIWYNKDNINNTTEIKPDIEIHKLLDIKKIL